MKIYTKTGDKGETGLFGGKRVPKTNQRIIAYGTTDELNAHIGLIRDQEVLKYKKEQLLEIQDKLFVLGAIVANESNKPLKGMPELEIKDIELLETDMDLMDKDLPPMRHFILPGGHTAVSFVHIARCVCRRAEREMVKLSEEEQIDHNIVVYLNRLSDWLFVLARHLAHRLELEEIPWKPR